MEKIFEFNINQKIYNLICRRIKLKSHLIELLIEVCSLIIINAQLKGDGLGKFIIKTDNIRRIFFSIQDNTTGVYKHFSFNFPFKILKEEGILKLETLNGHVLIESSHIAILRTICSSGAFNEKECVYGLLLDFSELVESSINSLGLQEKYYERDLNQILMELFTFEPGYIRYDYDKDNENGRFHPLNHLDIFYTQSTTFKLGCAMIELSKFIDILDIDTECAYLGG